MVLLPRNSATWILSLKVFFVSVGVLSMAVALKLSVPAMVEFVVNEVPVMWKFLASWLKPPFLYVIINGIIIAIAASSRRQQSAHEQLEAVPVPVALAPVPANFSADLPMEIQPTYDVVEWPMMGCEQREARVLEVKTVINSSEAEDEDVSVISRSTWTPPSRSDSTEIPTGYLSPAEKPPVSARFNHRKSVKASPEGGKALRVAKPKRHETLENTWKAITEGRPMPLTRHLKKSDTWEHHGRPSPEVPAEYASPQKAKKSETFKDRTNNMSPPAPEPTRLRKESSLSQEELNRRVEAFINKFNEEMRLQRQESLNQYMEMINR
ncbi:uncharacterized protein LOC131153197 [Malania oleifera]|uniref:uncharacterized protein LOC131153197 n=1 Tax=Malania oleifera TaxID=397392 RepID=UPI0025ADA1DE|nr:uncharacterized protein LOC131153197 [Malania oleifera]